MKKNILKKMAKNSQKQRTVWVAVVILAITQIASAAYIAKMHTLLAKYSEARMDSLIATTEERRYKYPVIDVTEEKVYLPELRAYLPLTDTSRDLRYEVSTAPNGQKNVYFSVSSAVGRQTKYDVPTCDKVVSLMPTEQTNPYFLYAGKLPANKYNLRYVIRHKACTIYPDSTSENLAGVVLQLRFY